jgi:hypothetical protein
MSKAGPSLLRSAFVRAADGARKQDPQLARIYYLQMTGRGAGHLKACCVVAGHLAERAWTTMNRGTPYVICDNDGKPGHPGRGQADHRGEASRSQWMSPHLRSMASQAGAMPLAIRLFAHHPPLRPSRDPKRLEDRILLLPNRDHRAPVGSPTRKTGAHHVPRQMPSS